MVRDIYRRLYKGKNKNTMKSLALIRDFLKVSFTPYPERDWLYALVVFSVCLVGFVVYAAYVSFGLRSGMFINSSYQLPPAPSLNQSEINSLLQAYRVRKDRYNASQSSISFPDPARTQ